MDIRTIYTVVGGDRRAITMANALAQGVERKIYGLFLERGGGLSPAVVQGESIQQVLPQAQVAVFPLPMADSAHIEACLPLLKPGTLVLGGQIPQTLGQRMERQGLCWVDYAVREEFAVNNAVLTAEAAVGIALEKRERSLFGARCLIVGYGRIAKALAKLLVGFGAQVQVAARKPADLAWIAIAGAAAVPMTRLNDSLPQVEIVFNTVPVPLLGEQELVRLGPGALVIDLASRPGGVDRDTAAGMGIPVIWALGLPGKTAPVTAGEILADTIRNIVEEKNTGGTPHTSPKERRQRG